MSALLFAAVGVLGVVLGTAAQPPPEARADALGRDPIGSYAQLRVTGLGDSVPAGNACSCTPYVQLFAGSAAAALGAGPDVRNLARSGLTSSGLLTQLGSGPARAAIARSDVVTVTIGANDFEEAALSRPGCVADGGLVCFRGGLATLRSNLDDALTRLDRLGSPRRARLLVTGYWNVFKDGAVARSRGAGYVTGSYALTRAVNAVIRQVAQAHGATYVDVFGPFNGGGGRDDTALLAADGDHPNARGHALIASLLFDGWNAG